MTDRDEDAPSPGLEEPIESAIEAVTVAVSAVPVVGGPLAQAATAIIRQRQSRRLNRFLLDLVNDVQRLTDHVNHDFVRTDEFQDLAEEIVEDAAKTRSQAKLDAFRAIFLNTLLQAKPNYSEATEIATLIDGLQERHVILLRILADPVRANDEMGKPIEVPSGFGITSIRQLLKRLLPEWDDDQIERTWSELYDRNLHRTPGTITLMTDSGVRQLENRLTPFGLTVVRYMTSPL